MKMFWFFTATSEIPWAFKLCGIFQMCCDLFLGAQYFVFGDGPGVGLEMGRKDHLSPVEGLYDPYASREINGFEMAPRRATIGEKDVR